VNIKHRFILIIIAVLVCFSLILTSCTGGIARGWAGGTASDGKLFLASMTGRLIVVNAADNTVQGKPVQMVIPAGNSLSCLPASCGGASSSPLVIYASPAVQGEVVYVAGTDSKIYGYQYSATGLLSDPEWTYPKSGSMPGSIIGGILC